jgi:hypothetical protein
MRCEIYFDWITKFDSKSKSFLKIMLYNKQILKHFSNSIHTINETQ